MRKFRKYEFNTEAEALTKIEALGIDEEGNPTHSHSIVHLGHIVLEQGEYDEQGNEIKAPILSTKYHIDVLWNGEAQWTENIVWCPPMGVHTFGSSSAIREWTEKCKELHPEYFPQNESTDI